MWSTMAPDSEQFEFARLDGRHLAKRLQRAIGGGRQILGSDQPLPIGDTCLLERPAHAQVAHLALRERRDPAECSQRDHRSTPGFG